MDSLIVTYGKSSVITYLRAVWQCNVESGKRFSNFILVRNLYGENRGTENFLDLASRLDAIHLVEYYKSQRGVDICIKEELVPFVEDILMKN